MRNSFELDTGGMRLLAVLKDAVDASVERGGGGAKDIARRIGRPYDHLIKCLQGKLHFHADSVVPFCEATDDSLLFELARQRGYRCVPIKEARGESINPRKAHRATTGFVEDLLEAAEDGEVTPLEAAKIRRSGDIAKQVIDKQISAAGEASRNRRSTAVDGGRRAAVSM